MLCLSEKQTRELRNIGTVQPGSLGAPIDFISPKEVSYHGSKQL